MEFIDTHTHCYDEAFAGVEDEIIARAVSAGVSLMLQADIDSHERGRMLELTARHPERLRHMLGLYPGSVHEDWRDELDAVEAAYDGKAVAVGEIGLDYYWMTDPKEVQREWFIRQLRLAKEENLPVVIHSRDASQDTFDIMKAEHAGTTGGVIHCYSGSLEMAREYVKLGYYLGIGGVVTFKNSKVLKKVAAEIPLEHIVVETDCPYLAPTPHRGKRNSSAYLPLVIKEIAALRDISPEEVEQATYENACRLYGLQ